MDDLATTRSEERTVGEKRRSALRTALRVVVALVLLGACALLWQDELAYRGWEAWAAGHLTQAAGGGDVLVNQAHAAFYVGIYRSDVFGATITAECTSALVTIGILAATALLMMTTRLGMVRLAVAGLVASSTFIALNQFRVVGIALATKEWGMGTGFHWSHVWGGTFVTVFGGVGVCILYLVMLGVRRRPGTTR